MGIEDHLIFNNWEQGDIHGVRKSLQNKQLNLAQVKASIDQRTDLTPQSGRKEAAKTLVDTYIKSYSDDGIIGDGNGDKGLTGSLEWKEFGQFVERYGIDKGQIQDAPDDLLSRLSQETNEEEKLKLQKELAEYDLMSTIASKNSTNNVWEWKSGFLQTLGSSTTTQTQQTQEAQATEQTQNPNTSAPSASLVQEKGNPEIKYIQIENLSLDELQENIWFKLGDKIVPWPKERFSNGLVPLDLFVDFNNEGNINLPDKIEITSTANQNPTPTEGFQEISLNTNSQTTITAPESAINLGNENFAAANNAITLPEGIKNSLGRSLKKLTNYALTAEVPLKVMNGENEIEGLDYNPNTKAFVNTTSREINIPANTELIMEFTFDNQTITLTGKVGGQAINLAPAQNGNTQELELLDHTREENKITLKNFYTSNSSLFNQLGISTDAAELEEKQLQGLAFIRQVFEIAKQKPEAEEEFNLEKLLKNNNLTQGQRLQLSMGLKMLNNGALPPDKVQSYTSYMPSIGEVQIPEGKEETIRSYINGLNGGVAGGNWFNKESPTTLLQASVDLFGVESLADNASDEDKTNAIKKAAVGWIGIYKNHRKHEDFKKFAAEFLVQGSQTDPNQRKAEIENIVQTLQKYSSETDKTWTTENGRKLKIGNTTTNLALTQPAWDDGQGFIAAEILKLIFTNKYQKQLQSSAYPEYKENGMWYAQNPSSEVQVSFAPTTSGQQPTITIVPNA